MNYRRVKGPNDCLEPEADHEWHPSVEQLAAAVAKRIEEEPHAAAEAMVALDKALTPEQIKAEVKYMLDYFVERAKLALIEDYYNAL